MGLRAGLDGRKFSSPPGFLFVNNFIVLCSNTIYFILFLTNQLCLQVRVWYACTHKLLAALFLLGVEGLPVVCVTH